MADPIPRALRGFTQAVAPALISPPPELFGLPQAQPAPCDAGIDPGKTGWVVVEFPDGTLRGWQIPTYEVPPKKKGDRKRTKYDLPKIVDIVAALKRLGVTCVTLEAQQPTHMRASQGNMANNAVRASFTTGYGFALWEMALTMAGIDYILAWPSAWKKKMGIQAPSEMKDQKARERETKRLAVQEAQAIWPDHDFRRTPRCQPSPDQCEAALLVRYGRAKRGG